MSASGSITDVPGIRVGHVTDRVGLTGCTVVLCDAPAVGGVTLRGWANAVHGLEFLDPRHIVPGVDGALLAGGSAYGLEAVWGVMRFLEGRGTGFRAGPTVVPHVPAAILFDLNVGDMHARPTREMGYAAAANATPAAPGEGSVGAGTGATVGKLHRIERAMRGGIGSASTQAEGAVVGPENTTIGVIATDARLSKAEAVKVAELGMTGFARALSPPHTAVDGDTLFTLSVGDVRADLTALGLAAAEAVARAIARAVLAATSLPGIPAARDL